MIKVERKYIEPIQFDKNRLYETKQEILQRIYDRLSPVKFDLGIIYPKNK